ncbi:hypothetical protein KFL_010170020 [Klebsormidium nitens]|uniref:Uncharacterized protein n=1 Tax=Klebsormidium nitens TaxID=105231 RepID=A0A1Y1IP77_KLENI|nr:hypothetical protein KFL_010170020 [Klebsormidium nitens]|eukprot:GAQ92453.1 hypothetical protein KFL_010170020 [Klebsormidium nitens]
MEGVAASVLSSECFLAWYSEHLWKDKRYPQCSMLPLLCRETRDADRKGNPRLVLRFSSEMDESGAVCRAVRSGLTHLAICNPSDPFRGRKMMPWFEVLRDAEKTRTLCELVLDLRGMWLEPSKFDFRELGSSDRFPKLTTLVVLIERGVGTLFEMLQKTLDIKDFCVETPWATLVACPESSSISLVVGAIRWVTWEEVSALVDLLTSREDFSRMHLTLQIPHWEHLDKMMKIVKQGEWQDVVVDLLIETLHDEIPCWFGRNRLSLNLHKHYEFGGKKSYPGSLSYSPGKVYLDSKQSWTKFFVEYLVDANIDVKVIWNFTLA